MVKLLCEQTTAIQNCKCLWNAHYAARLCQCQALTSNSGVSFVTGQRHNVLLIALAETEKWKQWLVSIDMFVKQVSSVSLNNFLKSQMFDQP